MVSFDCWMCVRSCFLVKAINWRNGDGMAGAGMSATGVGEGEGWWLLSMSELPSCVLVMLNGFSGCDMLADVGVDAGCAGVVCSVVGRRVFD